MRVFTVTEAVERLEAELDDDLVVGLSPDESGVRIVIVAQSGYVFKYSPSYWLGYEVVVNTLDDEALDTSDPITGDLAAKESDLVISITMGTSFEEKLAVFDNICIPLEVVEKIEAI